MKLSILTPAVPSRLWQLDVLSKKIKEQSTPEVEHLIFLDNKQRRVGAKRQGLLDLARGEYIAYVDDDDDISANYVRKILEAIDRQPDVVTFWQGCTVNGQNGTINFDLVHRLDEPFKPGSVAKRRPWHVCVWRRGLAVQGVFPEINYGEDAAWLSQVFPLARTQVHIEDHLHFYRHDARTTEAPPE